MTEYLDFLQEPVEGHPKACFTHAIPNIIDGLALKLLLAMARLLHRMSLTPGSAPDAAALLAERGAEEQDAGAVSSAPSVADSLEMIAAGQNPALSGTWASISPVLDFQEFLQRQQRLTQASILCVLRMPCMHACIPLAD